MMKRKTFMVLAMLGISIAGCTNNESHEKVASASSSSSKVSLSSKSSSKVALPVGKIISRKKMNVDDAS